MNNSTFGRLLMNVRKNIDFHLANNKKKHNELICNPRCQDFIIYNENLTGILLKKKTILLNKPIYAGLTVLESSKITMYNFHYNWSIKKYGDKIKLLMTDTDSLLYNIQTDDIYDDIKKDEQLFDISEYPKDHKCYNPINCKVPGTLKDELSGVPILKFIGLRAKCYCVAPFEGKDKKTAKGVLRSAIKNQLCYEDYEECLFLHKEKYTSAYTIGSKHHELFTQKVTKLALSPFDDKRYVADDGLKTYAYGYYNNYH